MRQAWTWTKIIKTAALNQYIDNNKRIYIYIYTHNSVILLVLSLSLSHLDYTWICSSLGHDHTTLRIHSSTNRGRSWSFGRSKYFQTDVCNTSEIFCSFPVLKFSSWRLIWKKSKLLKKLTSISLPRNWEVTAAQILQSK